MESLYFILNLLAGEVKTHIDRARKSSTVGAVSMEYVLIAVAVIAIAGIVIGAVTLFVQSKAAQIK